MTNPVNPINFFSRILSSAQRLPNGNTLICDGDSGYFFEIDASENIVWEYINPSSTEGILTQGDNPENFANTVFRAIKYAPEYSAFNGRDLTPGNPIEQNPDLSNCDILSIDDHTFSNLKVYPNPTSTSVEISSNSIIDKIEVYNMLGAKINSIQNSNKIYLNDYKSGIYIIKIYSGNLSTVRKIIKQ